MKIDRVIMSSNNDPLYYDFWNPLSEVYLKKFKIKPTLVWVGTEQQMKDCNISDKHGDVIILSPHTDYPISSQCTIANFYATKFFLNEICFICGIDQIPLSNMFTSDLIKNYNDEDYIMMISDAYLPNHWKNNNGTSPSSYHISKGSSFNEIYEFESDFKDEIEKIYQSNTLESYMNTDRKRVIQLSYWGIDESYFSMMLRKYQGKINIVDLNQFKLLKERRIECYRTQETSYDLDKLKSGWYSEAHLCRPFSGHSDYITKLLNNIEINE
jgi:hypothetical protein